MLELNNGRCRNCVPLPPIALQPLIKRTCILKERKKNELLRLEAVALVINKRSGDTRVVR